MRTYPIIYSSMLLFDSKSYDVFEVSRNEFKKNL